MLAFISALISGIIMHFINNLLMKYTYERKTLRINEKNKN